MRKRPIRDLLVCIMLAMTFNTAARRILIFFVPEVHPALVFLVQVLGSVFGVYAFTVIIPPPDDQDT